MTDQINALLHEGADDIAVPPAPAGAILGRGRRLRRRRRALAAGAGAVATLAVVGVVAVVPFDRASDDGFPELAPAAPIDPDGWAVAQGSTVHLGNGRTAEVPGKVKAMYYTSAGVMVRTGRTAYTEGDAVSNYFVLGSDGEVRDFSLDLGDKKPGTDPTLPYLAYSVKGDDATHWELVLRDVRTGEVATRVPYEGSFTWGGWNAPPTALSGDFAYVGVDEATLAINWRTGVVSVADGLLPSRMPTVSGGRELVDPDGLPPGVVNAKGQVVHPDKEFTQIFRVVDAETGESLRDVPVTGSMTSMIWPRFSADGGHVLLSPTMACDDRGCSYESASLDLIAVDSGNRLAMPFDQEGTYGWSPDGRLLLVSETAVKSCDADTGECLTTPVEIDGTGPLRVSGNDNES